MLAREAVTDAAEIQLSEPQALRLRMAVAAARKGEVAAAGDPVMNALARRGLVDCRPDPTRPGRAAFVATIAGRDWVRADDARNDRTSAERTKLPSSWRGESAEGSRWTAGQLAALARAEVADPEACDTATVTRRADVPERDWTTRAPQIRVELPCLARNGGRGRVVLPSGAVQWLPIVSRKDIRRG